MLSLITVDLIGLIFPIYLTCYILNSHNQGLFSSGLSNWITLHWLISLICISWFMIKLKHYIFRKTIWFELKETLRTLLIVGIIEVIVNSFTPWHLPQKSIVINWLLILLLLPLMRILTKKFLNKISIWQRDTIIVGTGKNAIEAYQAIKGQNNLGYNIILFIGEVNDKIKEKKIDFTPVEYIGLDYLKHQNDKDIQFIIAVEDEEYRIRNSWLKSLMGKKYNFVSVVPTLRGIPLDSTNMSFIFSHEVMIFQMDQGLMKLTSRLMKRLFDLLMSITILLLLSPLLSFISYKIKKDGGAVLFSHERIGKEGKPFKCLKFRSMAENSKQLLTELLDKDPVAREEWQKSFKLKNDPRVTKIGQFLRFTSLDELPQLFNVLRGEMSLVGPRPIIHEELERYHEEVEYYLMSKPGMTGLWQVSGRSDVDYETRVYFDAWYVKNWSMWHDIIIMLKTIQVVLKKNGAY